jgi:hypothetical protein
MRAVGLITAATAGGCRLSGPRQVTGASDPNAMVSSFASPDVDFASRADGRIGPMIELTHSRWRSVSRLARLERS